MHEIVFEPLDTGEVDEIRRFIEEEEVRSGEKYLRKCYLGPLTT